MKQKERYTKARPKQNDREEQSKPVSQEERSEIVEQLQLLNYNLLSIGLILGGPLGIIAQGVNPLNSSTGGVVREIRNNMAKMNKVNTEKGGIYEEH